LSRNVGYNNGLQVDQSITVLDEFGERHSTSLIDELCNCNPGKSASTHKHTHTQTVSHDAFLFLTDQKEKVLTGIQLVLRDVDELPAIIDDPGQRALP
jgi:hypothetical protein